MNKQIKPQSTGCSPSKLAWVSAGILFVLVAWEFLAYLIGTPGIFPHIVQIGQAFVFWAQSGLLADDLRESLPPIGIAIGLAVGLVAPVRLAFEWFLDFFCALYRQSPCCPCSFYGSASTGGPNWHPLSLFAFFRWQSRRRRRQPMRMRNSANSQETCAWDRFFM